MCIAEQPVAASNRKRSDCIFAEVDFLKKLLEENRIVLPDDYYDLLFIQLYL